MVKGIGIAFIFVFCTLVGKQLADDYKNEYKKVTMLCDMLFDIKEYVGYESLIFSRMINELRSNTRYRSFFFLNTKSYAQKQDIIDILEKTNTFKNKEYNERLLRLFKLLGTTDKQSQLELITNTSEYFSSQADMLRAQLPKAKRLYLSLGISAGALIAVILL